MAELIAAASAFTEPLRPENTIVDATALTPSPPGTRPTSRFMKLTSRPAEPEWNRISPARMKSGTASSVNESTP